MHSCTKGEVRVIEKFSWDEGAYIEFNEVLEMKLDAMIELHIKEMEMRINNMVHDIGVLLAQKETLMDEKSKLESLMGVHGNKT